MNLYTKLRSFFLFWSIHISILVAKEVLLAERGGQWLLSCFAPLKERPCIPGMKDLSPEEVRWEMYHAQKNGMVEQAVSEFMPELFEQ